MDEYEFNIKVEQIKKMVSRGDYEMAMRIADTIGRYRVRDVNILSMVVIIYEKNEEYQRAKDILPLALERASIRKRLPFKLTELATREGSFWEAEGYYGELCDLMPGDPRQYIPYCPTLGARGAPAEQLIHTPEQYYNIELDEKWLYELVELYAKADMGELYIMAHDRIMLMFDLGKYVEKAMELKIQFASLTEYQMNPVENRDKYGTRPKAVEQEYRSGKQSADHEPMSERKTEVSPQSYMARREAVFTVEPEAKYLEDGYAQAGHRKGRYVEDDYARTGYRETGYAEEEYSEDDYLEGDCQKNGYQTEVYQEDTYTDEDDSEEAYGWQGYYGSGYPNQSPQDNTEGGVKTRYPGEHCGNATGAEKSYKDKDVYARITIGPEDSEGEKESAEETQSQWMSDKLRILSDEAVRAGMYEAEVQVDLIKEMSRISDGRYRPGTTSAQTRTLADVKDLGRELSVQESHHFMIEAEYSSSDLDQATEPLKKAHKETEAKNQAAKIAGKKFNSKGVFAITDKLTGKDLIIEQVGAMEESTLQELNQLMTGDEIGINVALIDVAGNLARTHRIYPGLIKRFEYIGKVGLEKAAYVAPEGDSHPVRPVQPRRTEEPIMPGKVQSRKEEPVVSKAQPVPEPAAPRSLPKPEPEQRPDTNRKAETEQKPNPVRRRMEESRPEPVVRREEHKEVPLKAVENLPVLSQSDELDYDDQQEMDIDEFAQYICRYASDIDCSISRKSMLVFYKRIEVMEGGDVLLTKVSAGDLTGGAADKAENPSLFKQITGIFSSKYDRDGPLILKEEHFM